MSINRSKIKGLALICFIVFSFQAFGQPSVSSISYDSSTNKVTVTGSGFGQGPDVVLFDDFETELSNYGQSIPLNGLLVGEWTTLNNYYPALLDDRSHSGDSSVLTYDMDNKVPRIMTKEFDVPVQDVFISYWVSVPQGTYFPGSNTTGLKSFPSDSSWKFSWLIDEDTGTESSNVCAPTHVGGGRFMVAGNDLNIMGIDGNDWWSWNSWNRFSVGLIANETDPTLQGLTEFMAISSEKSVFKQVSNAAVFDEDGSPTKKYQRINIPGWIRPSGNNLVQTLYDDVYVAVGRSAMSRVEFSDSEDYMTSKHVAIQQINEWSDSNIVFTPRQGGLVSLDSVFVHFFDKDGESMLIGQISIQDTSAPKPPPSLIAR